MEGKLVRTKHLPVNVFLEFGNPLPADSLDLRRMHHSTYGVDWLLIHQELKLDDLAFSPASVLVVQCGVSLAACHQSMTTFS